MITLAFLLAGAVSFLVAAVVTIWRFVLERRNILEPPAWDSMLSLINTLLAMVFFSLGIYHSLGGDFGGDANGAATPQAEVKATAPAPGSTIILVPVPVPGSQNTPPANRGRPTPTPPGIMPEPADATPMPVLPAVLITVPRDGSAVSLSAQVHGSSQGVRPGQALNGQDPWVYLLVRRREDSQTTWWVQQYPVVEPNGRWSGFLTHGLADAGSGTEFDICAIVSSESLSPGQREDEPSAVSRHCVTVQAT